ncbi:MAG: hypothetical protein K8R85_03810 [Bacteroidetes bacterium]|nr:hypothetical protein [Bacteroidota bacterium]
MNINKNNYEAYFLDYHEGNLTPAQVADLLRFVEQHPQLKEELESFENFSLEDFSSVEFENKSRLKKEVTLENKNEYFIRAVENELNSTEISLLNNFLTQHPQFKADLELFQKTKLSLDTTIVFEHKKGLKRFDPAEAVPNVSEVDELLISAMEGLLSTEELNLLNERLVEDKQLTKKNVLFNKTKLVADGSIVFEDKASLKHKLNKIIPFYYYISAAAAILLLFGLFFLFNYNTIQPEMAIKVPLIKDKKSELIESPVLVENKAVKIITPPINSITLVLKNEKAKKNNLNLQDSLLTSNVVVPNLSIVSNKESVALFIDTDSSLIEPYKMVQLADNSIELAKPVKKIGTEKPAEFLSIPELAVEKIKEKLLDKNAIAAQKKSGDLKKVTGWDIAQVLTTGISKLTGREVELKPYYNDEGTVTAYALNAGAFQISRGR